MWRLVVCAVASLWECACASPTLERPRSSISVSYRDGAWATVTCLKIDRCSLELAHHGRRFEVPADALDGLVILPNALALLDYTASGRSVVQVEVGCADYAAEPPAYICIGQLTFEDAELEEVLVIKRTLVDMRDAKPFRIDS